MVKILLSMNIEIKTIVDAGANIGLTTIYLKHYFQHAKVLSLEPSEETYLRMVANFDLNELTNIQCIRKGIWSESKKLGFDKDFRDRQDWSYRLTDVNHTNTGTIEVLSVKDLMRINNIDQIDLFKIDIEGGERELFDSENVKGWLTKVKVIVLEIHDEFDCRTQIESLLSKSGFELSHSGELTIGINPSLA